MKIFKDFDYCLLYGKENFNKKINVITDCLTLKDKKQIVNRTMCDTLYPLLNQTEAIESIN